MSKIIDDNLKVVLGQMIKVQNKEKKNLENDDYIAVQVEDQNGYNERCLLFTEIQLSDMPKVDSKFLNDNLVNGRLYSFVIGKQKSFLIKMFNRYKQDKIYRVSFAKLKKAQKRALNNPQDLTKKNWLTDLTD